MTRAHGSLNTYIVGGYLLLIMFSLFVLLFGLMLGTPGMGFSASIACYLLAIGVAVVTSASSIAGELRAKSLETLCVTRLSGARILSGKLLSTMILAGPALLGAAITLMMGVGVVADINLHEAPPLPVQLILLSKWVALASWMMISTLGMAVLSHSMAVRVKSASRVWIATAFWTALMITVPLMAMALWGGNPVVATLVTLVNPLLSTEFWDAEAYPIAGAGAVVLWSVMTVGLFLTNGRQLLRRAVEG